MNTNRTEVARTTLAVLFIGVLIAASGWILRPFLPALIWATMVVVATWPVMLRVQRQLGNRRAPAVMVMTLLVLLVLVVPLSLAISTLVENAQQIVSWVKFVSSFEVPPPPHGVPNQTLVGTKLARWKLLVAAVDRHFELTLVTGLQEANQSIVLKLFADWANKNRRHGRRILTRRIAS